MQTFNLTTARSHFSGNVRVSQGVMSDTMFVEQSCVDQFDIWPVERLKMLLEDVANQLVHYPAGTQAARLTHYRIPPSGSLNDPLALDLEAVAVEGDEEFGDYLLIALSHEIDHSALTLPLRAVIA